MRSILATIALEPRRWTPAPRYPAMTLHYLLPHIAAAGFDKIEAWQWHATSPTLDELEIIRAQADTLGVSMPYIGVYPFFHLENGPTAAAARQELMDLIVRAEILGAQRFKIMLGRRKGSDITAAELVRHNQRFAEWYDACSEKGIQIVVELHGGTLFDPWTYGKQWLADHPEFEVGICFQPYTFGNTEAALALADEFADRIVHVHLQASTDGNYTLLQNADLDFTQLLPRLLSHNPNATVTIEFVEGCIQNDVPFDIQTVLTNARKDAVFVESILGKRKGDR